MAELGYKTATGVHNEPGCQPATHLGDVVTGDLPLYRHADTHLGSVVAIATITGNTVGEDLGKSGASPTEGTHHSNGGVRTSCVRTGTMDGGLDTP